jgi:hypothetical protein
MLSAYLKPEEHGELSRVRVDIGPDIPSYHISPVRSGRPSLPSHHLPYELLVLKETTSELKVSWRCSRTMEAYTITPRTVMVIELIAKLVSVNTVTH